MISNSINKYFTSKLFNISLIFVLIFNVVFLVYHSLIHFIPHNYNKIDLLVLTGNSWKLNKTCKLECRYIFPHRILFFLYSKLLLVGSHSSMTNLCLFQKQTSFENIFYVLKYMMGVKFSIQVFKQFNQMNFYTFSNGFGQDCRFSLPFFDEQILSKQVGISKSKNIFFYFLTNDILEFRSKHLPIFFEQIHFRLIAKITPKIRSRMEQTKFTLIDILSLASLIERETNSAAEKILISSVFYNRFQLLLKLQTDPSVEINKINLKHKILKMDLCRIHQYNTYLNYGVVEPIWFPRKESVHAALWPARTNFFYFVSRNNRTHIFCSKFTCHITANKQY